MKSHVQPTQRARRDMREAAGWYRAQSGSDEVAEHWLDCIAHAPESLSSNPQRCSRYPGLSDLDAEIRELSFGSRRRKTHRILFTISEDIVNVIRVRHFAQRDLTPDDL